MLFEFVSFSCVHKISIDFPLSALTKGYCDEISKCWNHILPDLHVATSLWLQTRTVMIHIDFAYHSILSCIVSNLMPFVCLYNGPIVRYNHFYASENCLNWWCDFIASKSFYAWNDAAWLFSFLFFWYEMIALRFAIGIHMRDWTHFQSILA